MTRQDKTPPQSPDPWVRGRVQLPAGPVLDWVTQGDRNGEPLLFLHGWPDSWFSFTPLMPLLPERIRAMAVTQRGFGDSDRPESGYTIPEMAGDILAFLDVLEIGQATLVGHSYGSFVARQVAIAQPARVSRLVLIGTGFAVGNAVVQDLPPAVRELPDPVPEDFAREFAASTVHLPLSPEFLEGVVRESVKLPARLWSELIERLLEYEDTHQLSGIAAPTLLLWGDRDSIFPRADQDRFLAACPRATLKIYEETGHCPNWERPAQVAADIVKFVEGS